MSTSSIITSAVFRYSVSLACCVLLLCSTSIPGQERPSDSPTRATTELAALRVLNDSDWARTVKPSLQDAPCTYENPAFPDLSRNKDKAATLNAMYPALPPDPVKTDGSEYLIRFQSAKPVQAAVEQLLAIGEKWSAYGKRRWQASEDDRPTDGANRWYNVGHMITVAVILRRPGLGGTTLADYGYEENGREFPSHGFHVWPCAGLRTANGQVFAHVVPWAFGVDGKPGALQLSFPRLIDGKPLISTMHEKVEFRMVANQRVFEATFYINATEVWDASEKMLYLPSTFTDAEEVAQQ